MLISLIVALGGAIGSLSRFWIGQAMNAFSITFPWSTFIVNIIGAFLIGFCAQNFIFSRLAFSENVRTFLIIGFCGGFTTFSTFSWQNFDFLRHGEYLYALLNILSSIVLCLFMTFLGFYLSQYLEKIYKNQIVTVETQKIEMQKNREK